MVKITRTFTENLGVSDVYKPQLPRGKTIANASASNAEAIYAFHRKIFYANGLHWCFIIGSGGIIYYTSPDGTTWTLGASSPMRGYDTGGDFSVWFDGTYMHYGYCINAPGSAGYPVNYRRGIPNANGSITWSKPEQTVTAALTKVIYAPVNVSVDSAGYPWVCYGVTDETEGSPYTYYPEAKKSSTNDGTWVTASGFPHDGDVTGMAAPGCCVIPLTAQKMLFLYEYVPSTGLLTAEAWTGSAWKAEVSTVSLSTTQNYFSAVAQGDNVACVFLKNNLDIIYTQYVYASNTFSTEVVIQSSTTPTSAPQISINPITGILYCFWAGMPGANRIYRSTYRTSWSPPTDTLFETGSYIAQNYYLRCFYNAYGDGTYGIGLFYQISPTSASYPNNILRYGFLTLGKKYVEYLQGFADVFTSVYKAVRHAYVRTFIENIFVSDVFSSVHKAFSRARLFVETIFVQDVFSRSVTYQRKNIETVIVQDIFLRKIQYTRRNLEVIYIQEKATFQQIVKIVRKWMAFLAKKARLKLRHDADLNL